MSDEKRLIKKLLNSYETVGVVGRPVLNQSETIHVNYGLALIQILDLDEKNQVLTTNVWSRYVSTNIFIFWLLIYYPHLSFLALPSCVVYFASSVPFTFLCSLLFSCVLTTEIVLVLYFRYSFSSCLRT